MSQDNRERVLGVSNDPNTIMSYGILIDQLMKYTAHKYQWNQRHIFIIIFFLTNLIITGQDCLIIFEGYHFWNHEVKANIGTSATQDIIIKRITNSLFVIIIRFKTAPTRKYNPHTPHIILFVSRNARVLQIGFGNPYLEYSAVKQNCFMSEPSHNPPRNI